MLLEKKPTRKPLQIKPSRIFSPVGNAAHNFPWAQKPPRLETSCSSFSRAGCRLVCVVTSESHLIPPSSLNCHVSRDRLQHEARWNKAEAKERHPTCLNRKVNRSLWPCFREDLAQRPDTHCPGLERGCLPSLCLTPTVISDTFKSPSPA